MPAKKSSPLSESMRMKRIREAAREHETSNDAASFERAFAAVARAPKSEKQNAEKKRRAE